MKPGSLFSYLPTPSCVGPRGGKRTTRCIHTPLLINFGCGRAYHHPPWPLGDVDVSESTSRPARWPRASHLVPLPPPDLSFSAWAHHSPRPRLAFLLHLTDPPGSLMIVGTCVTACRPGLGTESPPEHGALLCFLQGPPPSLCVNRVSTERSRLDGSGGLFGDTLTFRQAQCDRRKHFCLQGEAGVQPSYVHVNQRDTCPQPHHFTPSSRVGKNKRSWNVNEAGGRLEQATGKPPHPSLGLPNPQRVCQAAVATRGGWSPTNTPALVLRIRQVKVVAMTKHKAKAERTVWPQALKEDRKGTDGRGATVTSGHGVGGGWEEAGCPRSGVICVRG